ncbi:hypothetical protein FA95DRAFT_1551697 [Auriscalpium vulgare]|uniref:Uncharacterized protein n=1 Tax=Auriscalpium vulgare TaxID=40419 RepID=A0ACB8SDI4_9AGAM|nr:hypothetical protein FA95DRAFT_1551697 [Auriscalpium vulgare]
MTAGVPDDDVHWQRTQANNAPPYWTYARPIVKSQQDDREYRVIRLENGLQTMLVHDAKADKAAASLDVAVGHLYDPDDMPGLAHFCEHLLFMGTEQFPKENEYSEYLSKNNGYSNAFTASSNTNYYFNVGTPALAGALERFSAFFHSPLFNPSGTMRELNAVDSENKKNHQNDIWRIYQVNKHLSKPGHVWRKFGSGNKTSLTQVGRDLKAKGQLSGDELKAPSLAPSPIPSRLASPAPSTTSESESEADGGPVGRETRRRLVEWWSREYCASRMRLCIIGKEPLDELSDLAVKLFSPIPNRGRDPLPTISDHPFGPAEKGTLVSVQTIMAFHVLEISFPLEYQPPLWRYKPGDYLGDLLGHEGPGSLHSYLKHKGWITALSAGSQDLARGFAMLKATLYLTKDGFLHHRAAALAVFNYLSLLRSNPFPKWYQQEISALSNIRFRFLEKRRPDDYAVAVTDHMAWPVPRDLVLQAPRVRSEWDAEGTAEAQVTRTLASLHVGNGRGVLMARKEEFEELNGKQEWSAEPWYGTPYRVERFDEEFIKEADGPNTISALQLPRPNEFIPQNLDVERREVAEPQPRPHLIRETPLSTLWHKKDDRFWVPKAHVIMEMRSAVANESPKASVLTKLFADLVNDSLTEYAYAASEAGLSYNFSESTLGIYIVIAGYNDKLHILWRDIMEKVRNLQVQTDRLDVMKEQTKRDWENFFLGQTYRISDYYGRYLMNERQWTIPEKLEALAGITAVDVQQHILSLLSNLHSRILVIGNMRKDEAANLAKIAEDILSASPLASTEADLSLLLPDGCNYVWSLPVPNRNEPNSALTYYVYYGPLTDQRLRVTAALLTQILSEPAFDVLRTKEQLGYIVNASSWPSHGASHTGLHVVIQSERGPVYLEQRVEAFLDYMKGVIGDMKEEEFLEQKNGLGRKWTEAPKNIAEEVQRYWSHIDSGYLDFLRRSSDADLLNTITKDEVQALFLSRVHPSSSTRAKLSIHARSQKPPTKHISIAAAEAFVQLAKSEGLPVENIHWKEDLMASGEPTVAEFATFWQKALADSPAEVKQKLLEGVTSILENHPADKDAEGTYKDGVVHIKDVKAFKSSLAVSELPKPLAEWNDLPTPKF